jgi:CTP:molybdopterin cytidylyltransferase MocA
MALSGDRGMGPLIHGSPELVTEVPVDGDNPDVDTPADLARLAATGEETT